MLTHCNIHMYADDVQLYCPSTLASVNTCIRNIKRDLDMVSKYAAKHN